MVMSVFIQPFSRRMCPMMHEFCNSINRAIAELIKLAYTQSLTGQITYHCAQNTCTQIASTEL